MADALNQDQLNKFARKYERERKRVFKQAHDLSKTELGRDALRSIYKIDLKAPSDETRPIVAILVPCYKTPHPRMTHCLNLMVDYTRKVNAAIVYMQPYTQTSVVHWSRNGLIADLIRSGKPFTHILFIDDDIAPPADGLVRLLLHQKDIVAGLCTRRCDPPIPNMRLINMETCDVGEVWKWQPGTLLGEKVPEGHAFAIGTGMMLISKEALQRMADAYVNCDYEKEVHGLSGERLERAIKTRVERFDKLGNGWWFDFARPRVDYDQYGEDIYFCWFARKFCAIKTYIDTAVLPEHWGDYGYSIPDYISNRDEAVARAKADGKYIPPALLDNDREVGIPKQWENSRISVLCPSRGRPESVKQLLQSIKETADEMPEVIIYLDDDDMSDYESAVQGKAKIIRGPRITLSQMWNELLKHATGNIFFNCGDDVRFQTKGWDTMVKKEFEDSPDKLIFVHGDDGHWGRNFGTHGFVHRAWVEAVGYFVPPYFSSDYGDTWLNDVANAIERRRYIPIKTEHLHPAWGKAELDKTHQERLERHKQDDVDALYMKLLPKRLEDVAKLRKVMVQEEVAVG